MVGRVPLLFLLVVFEEREVYDPGEFILTGFGELQIGAQAGAYRAQGDAGRARLVCHEEEEIAGLGGKTRDDLRR